MAACVAAGLRAEKAVFMTDTRGIMTDPKDAGSFADGVKISHTLADDELFDAQQVAVEKVTFADGTVWNSPDVPASPAAEESTAFNVTPEF